MGTGRATGQYRARKPGLPAEYRGHGNEPQDRFFQSKIVHDLLPGRKQPAIQSTKI